MYEQAFVSVRADQRADPLRARFAQIVDGHAALGPIAGILAAQARHPGAGLAGAGLRSAAARCSARSSTCCARATRAAPRPPTAPATTACRSRCARSTSRVAHAAIDRVRRRRARLPAQVPDQRRHACCWISPNPQALDNVNTPARVCRRQRRAAPRRRTISPQGPDRAVLRAAARAGGAARGGAHHERAARRASCTRSSPRATRSRSPPRCCAWRSTPSSASGRQPLAAGDAVVFIPPVAGG